MKFSFTMLLCAIAISLVLLLPTVAAITIDDILSRPVVGDFTSASDMKPSVVLEYLAEHCNLNVSPLSSSSTSCFMANFMFLQFPNNQYGNQCAFEKSQIMNTVDRAFDGCLPTNNDNDEKEALVALLLDSDCTKQICDDAFHFQEIESHWMGSCAAITLPNVEAKSDGGTLGAYFDEEQNSLACMIQFATSTPPSYFGLPDPVAGSKESCYPPGYDDMEAFCDSELKLIALNECSDVLSIATWWNRAQLVSRFCWLMEDMSDKAALPCLLPLCGAYQDDHTAPPTFPPTVVPSREPTSSPSQTPTGLPTKQPSVTPTTAPSIEPTMHPSACPSSLPTGAPTDIPTSNPSSFPSEAPSTNPTKSEPDQVEVEVHTALFLRNVSIVDVNNENKQTFTEALEEGIASSLEPLDGTVIVKVTSLADANATDSMLDVKLNIFVTKDCYEADCSDPTLSDAMLVDFRETLEQSIGSGQEGGLTNTIQQSGRQHAVGALETAWVGDDLPFVRFSVRVRGAENSVSPADTSYATTTTHVSIMAIASMAALLFAH